jgi:hypothetical protein
MHVVYCDLKIQDYLIIWRWEQLTDIQDSSRLAASNPLTPGGKVLPECLHCNDVLLHACSSCSLSGIRLSNGDSFSSWIEA